MFVQYSAAGYEHVKGSVFNLCLSTGSEGDDETKGGKLPPRLEIHDHQSFCTSIAEWQALPCLIEIAVENLLWPHELARQTGTVHCQAVCYFSRTRNLRPWRCRHQLVHFVPRWPHTVCLFWLGQFENTTFVVWFYSGVSPWADPVSFVYGRFTASHRNKELPHTFLREWCADIRFLPSWWHGRTPTTFIWQRQWRGVVDAIQPITAARLEDWSDLVLVGDPPASDSISLITVGSTTVTPYVLFAISVFTLTVD